MSPEHESVESKVSHILETLESSAMMTKYVVLIEGIDGEGERAIYMFTNQEAKAWDNIGMLDYALESERLKIREDR